MFTLVLKCALSHECVNYGYFLQILILLPGGVTPNIRGYNTPEFSNFKITPFLLGFFSASNLYPIFEKRGDFELYKHPLLQKQGVSQEDSTLFLGNESVIDTEKPSIT